MEISIEDLMWGLGLILALLFVALISLTKKRKKKPICSKHGEYLEIREDITFCPRCNPEYKINEKNKTLM